MITHTAKAMRITVSDMNNFVPLFKMKLKMKSVIVLQIYNPCLSIYGVSEKNKI